MNIEYFYKHVAQIAYSVRRKYELSRELSSNENCVVPIIFALFASNQNYEWIFNDLSVIFTVIWWTFLQWEKTIAKVDG